jgi:hypothetical protein
LKTINKMKIKPLAILAVISIVYTSVLTIIVFRNTSKQQSLNAFATGESGQVYLLPASSNVSGEAIFQLWVNSNSNPFDFVHSEISFNSAAIKLSREVVYRGSLQKMIKLSTMQEANSTGKIVLAAGLDPQLQNRDEPLNGTYLLADIYFIPATTQNNLTTTLGVNNQTAKIVAPDASFFTVTTSGSTIILNPLAPTATNTPTATPKPTNTPLPTATKTPTATPRPTKTPVPTATRKPTKTPVPTATKIPTVTPKPTNTPPIPTDVIVPTMTPEPTNALVPNISCASLCSSKGYSSSTCRSSSQQCRRHNEYNLSTGNSYCVGYNDTCCCR